MYEFQLISLKFLPKGPINYISALVQTMVWRRLGDKPLSEPMMVSLLTHICVIRPQRVKPASADPACMLPKIGHHCTCRCPSTSWWRHQMETFSALLALCAGNSPVTGEFPSQRPVTRSFDVFFDLRLNKRLSTHSRRRWFKTPSCSLWRHCNVTASPMLTTKLNMHSTPFL